jgi:hypothetical protein
VNWANLNGVTEAQKEAYEIRAPWNPKPATFAVVARETQFKAKGGDPSEEGMRKRFKAASLAVFKASGVYFDSSGLGLDAYGVPKKNAELKKFIEDAGLPTTAAVATPSSDNRPAGTPVTPTQSATGRASHPRRVLRPAPHDDDQADADRIAEEHDDTKLYIGKIVTVRLQSPSPIAIYRHVDSELIPKYNSLLRERVSTAHGPRPVVLTLVPELLFSPAAFDR